MTNESLETHAKFFKNEPYREEEAAESQWVHRAHARLAYPSYRYESEEQIKANV